MSEPVEAEALFGSAARNDQDWLSDIDYLIVGDEGRTLRGRKAVK
jgi:predicted nucleotidyltransferase